MKDENKSQTNSPPSEGGSYVGTGPSGEYRMAFFLEHDVHGNWRFRWFDDKYQGSSTDHGAYSKAQAALEAFRADLEKKGFTVEFKKRANRDQPEGEAGKVKPGVDPAPQGELNSGRVRQTAPKREAAKETSVAAPAPLDIKSNTSNTPKEYLANPRHRAIKEKYETEFRDDWSSDIRFLKFFFGQYVLALPGVILGEIILPAFGIGSLLAAATGVATDLTWESLIRYLENEQPMTWGDAVIKAMIGVGPSAGVSSVKKVLPVLSRGLPAGSQASDLDVISQLTAPRNAHPKPIVYEVPNPASKGRPTWRESEKFVEDHYDWIGGKSQSSYKQGKKVPANTKGSTRPDVQVDGHLFEVKNYNLETNKGVHSLIKVLKKQINDRVSAVPTFFGQAINKNVIILDVRGQGLPKDRIESISHKISTAVGVSENNIQFVKWAGE